METVRRRRPPENGQGIILRIFNDKVGPSPDARTIPHNWQSYEKFFVYYLQPYDDEKKNELDGFTASDSAALVEFWLRERHHYIQQTGLEFEHRAAAMLNSLYPNCTRHFAPWKVNLHLAILLEAHRDALKKAIPGGHPIYADFREVPASIDHVSFSRFHIVYGYLGFQKTGLLLMDGKARQRSIKLGSDCWQNEKSWFATIRLKIRSSGHAVMPLRVPVLAFDDVLQSAQLPAFGTVEDLTLLECWYNHMKENQPSTTLEFEQRTVTGLNAVASRQGHKPHRSYEAKHVHLRLQFLLREYQQVLLSALRDKPLSISRTTFTHFGSVYRFLGGQKVVMEPSKWSEASSTWNKISSFVWQIPSLKDYEPWGWEYPYESDADSPDAATLSSANSRKQAAKGPRRATKSSEEGRDVIVVTDEGDTGDNDSKTTSAIQRAQDVAASNCHGNRSQSTPIKQENTEERIKQENTEERIKQENADSGYCSEPSDSAPGTADAVQALRSLDGVSEPVMQVNGPGETNRQTEKLTPLYATTAKRDIGRNKRPRSWDEKDGAGLSSNIENDRGVKLSSAEENRQLVVKVRRLELQVKRAEAEQWKAELEEEKKRHKETWEAEKRKRLRVELRESAMALHAAGMSIQAEEAMKKFMALADEECSSL